MFRKMILSAALATATLTGFALTPAMSDARPPVPVRPMGQRQMTFEVVYRDRNHWDVYASFRTRNEARQVARTLRQRGYQVKVREGC